MIDEDGSLRWSVRKRLEFIDFRLFWSGRLNRSDLSGRFGVSAAQATTDIARYEKLAPRNLVYDRASKTYRRSQDFAPALVGSEVEEHLAQLIAIENGWTDIGRTLFDTLPPVEVVALPRPRVDSLVLLRVLDAIREGREIATRDAAAPATSEREQHFAPHALFQVAGRWFARGWSRGDEEFRDFDVHGVPAATMGDSVDVDRAMDFEWTHWIDLVIVPNPNLPTQRRLTVASSHGMEDDRLVQPCRLCLTQHLMIAHNLDLAPGLLPAERQHLVLRNLDEVNRARIATRQMAREALARSRRAKPTHE